MQPVICPGEPFSTGPVECRRNSDCAGNKLCCPSGSPYHCEDGVDPTPRAGKLRSSVTNAQNIRDMQSLAMTKKCFNTR